jgi:hypothetical protein
VPTDPVVEFAQGRFGTDAGFPADAGARPRPPDWVGVGAALPVADEETVTVRPDDPITIEEREPVPQTEPAIDGTTVETLAFYLPFHFYRTAWGIYIRAAGLWALAGRLALPKKHPGLETLAVSYRLLLAHERAHFRAEYAASRIEVLTAEPRYEDYFKDVEAGLHEEALANAYALGQLRRHAVPKMIKAVAAWMATQPDGYRDFAKWLPPHTTEAHRRAAIAMSRVAAVTNRLSGAPSHAWHPAEFLFRQSSASVPVYFVLDLTTPSVRIVRPFPKDYGLQVFVHSNDHKPPHIHIESPPGKKRTRYTWPALTPLPGDPSLKAIEEKQLRKYLNRHHDAIAQRVVNIPWK